MFAFAAVHCVEIKARKRQRNREKHFFIGSFHRYFANGLHAAAVHGFTGNNAGSLLLCLHLAVLIHGSNLLVAGSPFDRIICRVGRKNLLDLQLYLL